MSLKKTLIELFIKAVQQNVKELNSNQLNVFNL